MNGRKRLSLCFVPTREGKLIDTLPISSPTLPIRDTARALVDSFSGDRRIPRVWKRSLPSYLGLSGAALLDAVSDGALSTSPKDSLSRFTASSLNILACA